jgi:hypothetical protein
MLLYPTTGQDLNEAMVVQGHRMRIATVDLSEDWEDIEARLLDLVNSVYESGPPAEHAATFKARNQ